MCILCRSYEQAVVGSIESNVLGSSPNINTTMASSLGSTASNLQDNMSKLVQHTNININMNVDMDLHRLTSSGDNLTQRASVYHARLQS